MFNKYTSLLILVSFFCLIHFFAPVDLLNCGFLVCLFLGFIIGLLLFCFFAEVNSINDIIYFNDKPRNINSLKLILCFVAAIGSAFFFTFSFENKLDNMIDKTGQFANATITDGFVTETTGRRGRSLTEYSITISYTPNESKTEQTFSAKIPSDLYENLSLDMPVEIKYLPSDPDIFRILVGDNYEKYKHTKTRNLTFNDIQKIIESKKNFLQEAKKIHPNWTFQDQTDSTSLYLNVLTKEVFEKGTNSFGYKNIVNLSKTDKPDFIDKKTIIKSEKNNDLVTYKLKNYNVVFKLGTLENDYRLCEFYYILPIK